MIIQNYKELTKTEQKKIATDIVEFGIMQALPQKILPKFIKKNRIVVNKKTINLAKYDKVYLVAFGKAADSMAKTVDNITKVDGGIVVIPKGTKSLVKNKKFQIFYAGHPIPTAQSYRAGKAVKEFVEKRTKREFIIFLVSGGASALMCVPEGITFEEKKHVNQVLIRSDATIQEINCVRKHLSAIKGGKLVEAIGCDAIALVMSDVIGDDLSSIASGYAYYDDTTFNDLPWKFEAGTMNIAEAVGLGAAIDYLKNIGMEQIRNRDKELVDYAMAQLKELDWIKIYGPKERGAVIAFNVNGVHAHDVSQILDSEGIAIRAGHHCCMPLMSVLGLAATARASFYLYNTEKEVDHFVEALYKVKKIFGV